MKVQKNSWVPCTSSVYQLFPLPLYLIESLFWASISFLQLKIWILSVKPFYCNLANRLSCQYLYTHLTMCNNVNNCIDFCGTCIWLKLLKASGEVTSLSLVYMAHDMLVGAVYVEIVSLCVSGSDTLLALLQPLIVAVCSNPSKYNDPNLHSTATLALTKFMTVR